MCHFPHFYPSDPHLAYGHEMETVPELEVLGWRVKRFRAQRQ